MESFQKYLLSKEGKDKKDKKDKKEKNDKMGKFCLFSPICHCCSPLRFCRIFFSIPLTETELRV
jgi:hypothetical protein